MTEKRLASYYRKNRDMTKKVFQIGEFVLSLFMFIILHVGLFLYEKSTWMWMIGIFVVFVCLYQVVKKVQISTRIYAIMIVAYTLCIVGAELYIMDTQMPTLIADFEIVKLQTEWYASYGGMNENISEYFSIFPNNVNIFILFSIIYKLSGSYKGVVAFVILCSNISSILTALSIKHLTHNSHASLFVFVLMEMLMVLTTRTYWPYTSNPGILFIILTFYLYVCPLPKIWKCVLIPFMASVALMIKLTAIIPFIAIIMVEGIQLMKNYHKDNMKYIAMSVLFTCLFFGVTKAYETYSWNKAGYTYDEGKYRGFWYFTCLGQYTESSGQWHSYVFNELGNYKGNKEERDNFYKQYTIKQVVDRGVVGNVKFYIAKSTAGWGSTNLDLVEINGKGVLCHFVRHSIWYSLMMLMSLAIFLNRRKDKYIHVAYLTISGVLLYLLISEIQFAYVWMYCPILFVLSGASVDGMGKLVCSNQNIS